MLSNNSSLQNFLEQIEPEIEPIIKKALSSGVDKKFQPAVRYQISAGGKRLRPGLAVLSCLALGGKTKDVLSSAAGLEILHNYTLIVDDMIDKSTLRRNKPTVWAKYGLSMAQCIAIDYSAAIFETTQDSPAPAAISQIFSVALKKIVNGEIEDVLFERAGRADEPFILAKRPFTVTKERYLKMVGKKTAALFEASCLVGGLCARASAEMQITLRDFGFNLGLAFQIQDDILDIFGEQKEFGKKIGKDIEERKGGNIILLLAIEELSDSQENKIIAIMKKKKIYRKDIKIATDLIRQTKALERAEEIGKKHIKKAKEALALLPKNKYTAYLAAIAEYAMRRRK